MITVVSLLLYIDETKVECLKKKK